MIIYIYIYIYIYTTHNSLILQPMLESHHHRVLELSHRAFYSDCSVVFFIEFEDRPEIRFSSIDLVLEILHEMCLDGMNTNSRCCAKRSEITLIWEIWFIGFISWVLVRAASNFHRLSGFVCMFAWCGCQGEQVPLWHGQSFKKWKSTFR